jgi:hypothetical protein
MTPKGATKTTISNVIATVPKIAGSTPPCVFASRGSVVRNSTQREPYMPSFSTQDRSFAG